MLKYAYKSDWGFTLIELLVAVLIISLFAGLAAPRLKNAWDNAKESTCKANMKQIEAALELYYLEYNKYPDAIEDNKVNIEELNLKNLPTCPHSKDDYTYTLDKTGYNLKCEYHKFLLSDTDVNFGDS